MSLVKNYTYKEIPYTITVYLNYTSERAMNGKSFHKIAIEIEDFSYSSSVMVDSKEDITNGITKAEEQAERVINEILEGPSKGNKTNEILIGLGFTEFNIPRKPITPEEMPKELPTYIIEAFDALIHDKFNISKKESTVYIKEAVAKVIEVAKSKNIEVTSAELFKNNLMDVEDTYRKAGWKVTYHKPDYTETSFPEYYIFKQK